MKLCPKCEGTFPDEHAVCPDDGEILVRAPTTIQERLEGEMLDERWMIETMLGEGGMGAVFRGRQKTLDRPVAIKVLRPQLSSAPTIVARFLREAKVLAALRHPNVVTILDFGQDDKHNVLYLVMELLDGAPLDDWLKSRPVRDRAAVVGIVEQITRALVAAHDLGIVHRDLKPANVFVTPVEGGLHVSVLDFGIAKFDDQQAEGEGLTKTGDVQGTPHYMAPEQAKGQNTGPATDLYSLGIILYELLSGSCPFEGSDVLSILFKHVNEPVPPLEQRWKLDDAIDPELVRITMRLLSKNPSNRPESARELLSNLQELAEPADMGGLVRQTEPADLAVSATLPGLAPGTRPEIEAQGKPRRQTEKLPPDAEAGSSAAPSSPSSGVHSIHPSTITAPENRRWVGFALAMVSSVLVLGGVVLGVSARSGDAPTDASPKDAPPIVVAPPIEPPKINDGAAEAMAAELLAAQSQAAAQEADSVAGAVRRSATTTTTSLNRPKRKSGGQKSGRKPPRAVQQCLDQGIAEQTCYDNFGWKP